MLAVENAVSTIISNILQLGQQPGAAVIVVAEDVDLFILLTAAAPVFSKIYLLKSGEGKRADMFYSPLGLKYSDNWKTTKHGLLPLTTDKAAAPEELINTMFCKFSKECHGGCTCKNNGMKCTDVCKGCKGQSCKNFPSDDELVTNCAYDKAKAILAIQKRGEVVEEKETEEEVSCEPSLKKIKPNQTYLRKHMMQFSFFK
ncbi:hypothetical protein ILUMI_02327 [Ignelater luminosus]|uniref:Tesmin/TSO1-like CXC domain-containing protein n=1 Tax=Ignelater luminosus TaxID=2038154 RepID=A0A8K0DCX7_IGNLU|nr:hypothetical protein ILUMI_02327 [Ignelater luminosus]